MSAMLAQLSSARRAAPITSLPVLIFAGGELSELEKFDTRYQIFRLLTLVAVGLIAAVLARVPVLRNWSSLIYMLLFPILRTSRVIHRRRRAPYLAAMAESAR